MNEQRERGYGNIVWCAVSVLFGCLTVLLLWEKDTHKTSLLLELPLMTAAVVSAAISRKTELSDKSRKKWLIGSVCAALPGYLDLEFLIGKAYLVILTVYAAVLICNNLFEGKCARERALLILTDPFWHMMIYAFLSYSGFTLNIPG